MNKIKINRENQNGECKLQLNKKFLPICKKDMKLNNIEQLDFVLITGDAYVDHPSFGTAIISRILEREGFTVGIIAQPNWKSADDFKKLGKPKLAFLINSGNMDSMVNHVRHVSSAN